jgi:hypothetical protein
MGAEVIEEDSVLVSVQHPGEITSASADNPLSHGGLQPAAPLRRDCLAVPCRGKLCD